MRDWTGSNFAAFKAGKIETIIVINIDSDAPFFNNADYGIIGDAFEIIPEIIQYLEKIKNDKS